MPATSGDLIASFPADNDILRLVVFYYRSGSALELKLIDDHSPGKIKPFVGTKPGGLGPCPLNGYIGQIQDYT